VLSTLHPEADWDQKVWAAIGFAGKASISLKMYLKSIAILEKASISLKKFSKIIEIFTKASHF
jgi:hypothetical protein